MIFYECSREANAVDLVFDHQPVAFSNSRYGKPSIDHFPKVFFSFSKSFWSQGLRSPLDLCYVANGLNARGSDQVYHSHSCSILDALESSLRKHLYGGALQSNYKKSEEQMNRGGRCQAAVFVWLL